VIVCCLDLWLLGVLTREARGGGACLCPAGALGASRV
jgi:hypothetical protein